MFGRRKKRSSFLPFVIFRLILSIVIFIALLGGIYSAYKHFSGLDPLKLDPQAILKNVLVAKLPQQFSDILGKQITKNIPVINVTSPSPVATKPLFRLMLLADSHNDNTNLEKAISQVKQSYPDLKFIIGLGDYTEVGTIDELTNAKSKLDSSGLRYFLIPGDHDLWDCRNRSLLPTDCFSQVFGPPFQAFTFENFRFILVYNSDNYVGVSKEQSAWITAELQKAKDEKVKGIFVFVHEPLFHPSSEHVMGWVEKNLKAQAKDLIFQLKDAGVKKVFAGDIHFFSEYTEPVTNLGMVTIGAVTIERNPQTPRFAVVSVFEDGTTKVEDVEIKVD